MFNLFKKDEGDQPLDVKAARATVLKTVKQELQKAEGGEGRNIKGIDLFVAAPGNVRHIYEAALYADDPVKLKSEIQKIADDFAVEIPDGWMLEVTYTDALPAEATPVKGAPAAMFIRTRDNTVKRAATAYIKVLNGEAEKKVYEIKSADGRINIGRDANVQVSDGFFRMNQIAFPADGASELNRYVSRQHAHIEWNNDTGSFMLFADEGGVPPGNKIKIRIASNDVLNKLVSTQIGHRLEEGDQVILGEGAVIAFTYKK
jgi:hypothetical protein